MKKRLYSALSLTVVISLLLALTSCGKQPAETVEKTTSANPTATVETADSEDSYEYAKSLIPDKDYGGYEFRALTMPATTVYQTYTARNVVASETTGVPINDAVYERNKYLEKKLNIKIIDIGIDTVNTSSGNGDQWDMLEEVERVCLAGLDTYDITFAPIKQLATYARDGCLIDLKSLDAIHLDKPWWDQGAVRDLTLNNKLYFCACDGDIIDKQTTWATMFNKDLMTELSLEYPYQMVKDGTWTIDEYLSYAKIATKDLDGNGTLDTKDRWGAITEYNSTYGFYSGFGGYIAAKDESDNPAFTMGSAEASSAISRALDVMFNKDSVLKVEDIDMEETTKWDFVAEMFANGQALFRTTDLNTVERWRTMDSDFGIVPMPKLNADQENYSCGVATGTGTGVGILQTVQDVDRTATILEAFVSTSRYTLIKGYYDATLNGVITRDEDSSEMLDIIFATRHFDLGYIFDWGGYGSILGEVGKSGTNTFSSSYEAKLTSAEKAMNRTLEQFAALAY
ncbi:MAG: hypothetical protein PUB08_07900 [Firmicutes bacterium]|nr:hypothetical protein [Bacillota bacterium]